MTTVAQGMAATKIGHFRYSMLDAADYVELVAGQSYVVGAFGYGAGGDMYGYKAEGQYTAPGITWESARLTPEANKFTCDLLGGNPGSGTTLCTATHLEFPNFSSTNGDKSWYGGTVGLAAVPVPAAIWLFGTALIGFLSFSRRTSIS
jgi:hypothetical protein